MRDFLSYVGGDFIGGGGTVDNINPSDISDVIGRASVVGAEAVDHAVTAALAALPAWQADVQTRSAVLDAAGTAILARRDELGRLLAREEGKTLAEGIGEVVRAGQVFKFFAGEAVRMRGDNMASVRPGVRVRTLRRAVGIVGIITPWNFPIAIPAWKAAPALAYGNAVIMKPATLVPGSAHALAAILHEAGVPAGIFNLVFGGGGSVGAALCNHERIDAVSFTGSTATGRSVAAACAARLARFQLEMGGKNPLVILDDADLDRALTCAVNGAYFSSGQRCTASSRLIVTAGIHDRFVAALCAKLASLKVGDALAPETDIGPVADRGQFEKVMGYIETGKREGAKLVFGGEPVTPDKGYYIRPALFTETDNHMRINREEIFGPVACVVRAANYDEALALANDSEFGLSAGICTSSLKYAEDFEAKAEAGLIMVNLPTAGVDYHVPFGGTKNSSFGPREQGAQAIEFYTETTTAYVAP